MKKITLCIYCSLYFISFSFAKGGDDSLQYEILKRAKLVDSVQKSLKWETKTVTVADGVARIRLSGGFKFLNAEQSKFVLHDLWGNPPREDVLG